MSDGNTTENDEEKVESDDQRHDSVADGGDTFAFRSMLGETSENGDSSAPDQSTDGNGENGMLPADSESAARLDPVDDGGFDRSADPDLRATDEVESAALDATTAGDDTEFDAASHAVDLSEPSYYLNRELSGLAFQRRVLHEVLDDDNPLLERVKFLAIVTTNLDEFFRKRVGGLKQQIAAGVIDETPDGRTPREQWAEALEEARPLFERQSECYREEIRPALAGEGIHIVDYDDLTTAERQHLREYFESSVLPTLTPLTFDPAHPFPFISIDLLPRRKSRESHHGISGRAWPSGFKTHTLQASIAGLQHQLGCLVGRSNGPLPQPSHRHPCVLLNGSLR